MGISKWNAGIIRPVPVAPAGPYETGAAPGVWTLDQVAYWQKQGLWPLAGNTLNYIEDMFSTYPYTGNGTTQTITNDIDLLNKGGLTWIKARNRVDNHALIDTVTGAGTGPSSYKFLSSNLTTAIKTDSTTGISAFNTNGFSLSGPNGTINGASFKYVAWTFREQPKFFDVVTWTGNNVSGRAIPHNLKSVPGCIIVKCTNNAQNWVVWHRSLSAGQFMLFNGTNAVNTNSAIFTTTTPTSTEFYVGADAASNSSTLTYVAYVFAHDAGGFGLTGTDNVISCGDYNGNNGNNIITLGYEPQWLLIKETTVGDGNSYWAMDDVRRGGVTAVGNVAQLQSNSTAAEDALGIVTTGPRATATGFEYVAGTLGAYNRSGSKYIYIAVRRGPMKVPTLGTSVFSVDTTTTQSDLTSTLTFPDMGLFKDRTTVANWFVSDRLRNFSAAYYTPTLYTNLENAEATPTTGDTITANGYNNVIYAGGAGVAGNYPLLYSFRRAPGFFDEVCYTGTGASLTHNLNATPELIIVKARGTTGPWRVSSVATTGIVLLNSANAKNSTDPFQTVTPCTATTMNLSNVSANISNVAYLFATVAAVSKVGSYTGTGALQTVACGFTTGTRFVLIKRTDAVGDWYVWDSARGISSGTDPYLLLNSTAAEVTVNNYVDTDTTGFKVTAAAPAALNAVGGTYIFLAIA